MEAIHALLRQCLEAPKQSFVIAYSPRSEANGRTCSGQGSNRLAIFDPQMDLKVRSPRIMGKGLYSDYIGIYAFFGGSIFQIHLGFWEGFLVSGPDTDIEPPN